MGLTDIKTTAIYSAGVSREINAALCYSVASKAADQIPFSVLRHVRGIAQEIERSSLYESLGGVILLTSRLLEG